MSSLAGVCLAKLGFGDSFFLCEGNIPWGGGGDVVSIDTFVPRDKKRKLRRLKLFVLTSSKRHRSFQEHFSISVKHFPGRAFSFPFEVLAFNLSLPQIRK